MKTFVLIILLAVAAAAQTPEKPTADGDRVVTRSELVVDLQRYLADWESRSSQYATKDELSELRALITQMRNEMDGLGERSGSLEDQLDGLEQRTENTRRPGF